MAKVAEYRLYGGKAAGDHLASGTAVDALAHSAQGVVRLGFRQEEHHLPSSGFLRGAQALFTLQAAQAIAQGTFELDGGLTLY